MPAAPDDRHQADFLAKVSHEVRTPLNSIIGFAELLKEEAHGPLGHEKYRGYVDAIHASGVHALSLINDLLDLSKMSAGRIAIERTAIDANELVSEAVQSMQPQARRARVVLRAALADDLPRLLADRRSLKQILLNLLSNAIKFTSAGGQVIVSSHRDPADGVRLRVRDTGVGMSDADIAQALEPFRQLDTAPRRHAGTGLGLPLAKAFAEANGARFTIDSRPGEGTRVDVLFPADRLAP